MEKTRREWDEQVTRMDVERLVKISRDHIPAGDLQGVQNEDGVTLCLVKTGGTAYNKEKEEKQFYRGMLIIISSSYSFLGHFITSMFIKYRQEF